MCQEILYFELLRALVVSLDLHKLLVIQYLAPLRFLFNGVYTENDQLSNHL